MKTKKVVVVDLHDVKRAVEDMCIIGASCSDLRTKDKVLDAKIKSLDVFIQKVWQGVKQAHFNAVS